jgi:LysR family glycine cleavage system transcriptional activator
MLQAAIDGLGVALTQNVLAGDDLAAGRLVRLFDYMLPTDYAYYVLLPEGTAQRPKIAAFRDWLLQEACGPAASPLAS